MFKQKGLDVFWFILKYLLFFCILFALFLFIFQRKLIYIPDKRQVYLNHYDQRQIEMLQWKNLRGIEYFGFYHQPSQYQPMIVFFHGNAGNIGDRKHLLYLFSEKGYGVFMPEYRGYGGMIGRPSELGLYEDGESAILFLLSKGIKESDMVLMGESLGTGVAIEMAKRFKVKALILQAPFLSLEAMRNRHYPFIKLPLLDKYQNQVKIKELSIPLLILHGSADTIVPYHHGEALYDFASQSTYRQLKIFDKASHQLPWDDEFMQSIDDFIHALNKIPIVK